MQTTFANELEQSESNCFDELAWIPSLSYDQQLIEHLSIGISSPVVKNPFHQGWSLKQKFLY